MQPLSTSSPRQRTLSLEWCIHRLTPPSAPAFLPVPSDLLALAAGDIPRGRVRAVPEGDTLRVRGQDSGPRRRRTPPTAQKCPRRRRPSPTSPHSHRSARFAPPTPRPRQPPEALTPTWMAALTSPHPTIRWRHPPTRRSFFTTLLDGGPRGRRKQLHMHLCPRGPHLRTSIRTPEDAT